MSAQPSLSIPGLEELDQEEKAPSVQKELREKRPGRRYEFFVAGEPRGMGSKTAFAYQGKDGRLRAVVTDKPARGPNEHKLPAWKDSVTAAGMAVRNGAEAIMHAVAVELVFHLRRPSGHYTPRGELRKSAPRWPETKPDLDKLKRSTLDALKVSGIFIEDSRVVRANVEKVYAESNAPTGAQIVVEEL